jgi:hypothetical protein
MILDDVFVNYDAGRTRTACSVLREFAKQGHQLLVFTCHEHVWRMFQDIKVDTRRIPNRHGEVVEEIPETPQPESVPEPQPEPVVAIVEPQPEPVAPEPEPAPKPVKVKAQPKPPVVIEEPEPVIEELEEEVVYEEPVIEPAPSAVSEVEYWWDSPSTNGTNGASHRDEDVTAGWMPEPEIRQRW